MHIIIQLLLVTFFATSAMTIFSYIISVSFKELYAEPLLLKYLLGRLDIKISNSYRGMLGWLIHYIIGFLFVLSYYFLWHYKIAPLTLLSGLILGAISGIIGIVSWIIMFKLSNFNRKATDKGYYVQLFFAHIIFALIAVLDYEYLLDIY